MNEAARNATNQMADVANARKKGTVKGFCLAWLIQIGVILALWGWQAAFEPNAEHNTFVNGEFVQCAQTSNATYLCEVIE